MISIHTLPAISLRCLILVILFANWANGQSIQRIRTSDDRQHFVIGNPAWPHKVWGVNYDHDRQGRLLDEYWEQSWPSVESDFSEIRELGANCVRVHFQLGKFMVAPDRVNEKSLKQLEKLLQLAEKNRLHLNITGLACYHKSNIPPWYDKLTEAQRWECQAVFWRAIARTCKANPTVFCFDLMNEPILPGKEPAKDWLAGDFGGKHFVQRIALDLKDRTRHEVAEAWVNKMVDAIRQEDKETLITVGVIPWALTWPNAKPLFYSPTVSRKLDFVSVHFYPGRNEVDKALKALKVYDIGKPIVVEEFFPLKCSQKELLTFVEQADQVDGWFSFYWGTTAKELRSDKSPRDAKRIIADQITASWLDAFQQLTQK